MKMSYNAAKLLKFVLGFTGEKEVSEKGEEINTLRRLNGEESSQRRHFYKAVEKVEKETETLVQDLTAEHNKKVEERRELFKKRNPQRKGEEEGDFERRIVKLLNQELDLVESIRKIQKETDLVLEKIFEIEITEKTQTVLKKYFVEFGEKAGFLDGDDKTVEEVQTLLN